MTSGILDDVLKELKRAKKKFPSWPDHIAARAGIVCEEAGELMKAALEYKYDRRPDADGETKQIAQMRKEAIQVAVTAIRFLENL